MRALPNGSAIGVLGHQISSSGQPLQVLRIELILVIRCREVGVGVSPRA
jgi:hypothetical protein